MCHIPCMNTSNTTGFPGATIRAGSHIVKPHSGWPIHILSVKLVMFCIESCTREDWFWNELFPSSNLVSLVIHQCEMWVLKLTISFSFFFLFDLVSLLPTHKEYRFSQIGGGEPEQLPIKPSLSVGLIPKVRNKKACSKSLELNKLRKYLMLRNSSDGWQALHRLAKDKRPNASITYPRALNRRGGFTTTGKQEAITVRWTKRLITGYYSVAIKVERLAKEKKNLIFKNSLTYFWKCWATSSSEAFPKRLLLRIW